jgi:hypothetical protein
MVGLKEHLQDFSHLRRQFLVEPESAARDFCSAPKEDLVCKLDVRIRVAGDWDGLCNHTEASTFYAERYYSLSLQCRSTLLKIYTRDLPKVESLIKR